MLLQGVLPTPGGVDGGVGDGRNGGGEQDAGVRELELQIDALYGVPSNSGGTTGPSPIRVVQGPMVSYDPVAGWVVDCDWLEWYGVWAAVDVMLQRSMGVRCIDWTGQGGGCLGDRLS